MSRVTISRVDTAVVQGNYDWTYARVHASDGSHGTGECFFAPGLTTTIRELGELLIGEDPRDIDRLWAKLRWAASGAGSAGGIVYNAITGLECALYDLVGRQLGVPAYQLLGGRHRESVRVYADCHADEALEPLDSLLVSRSLDPDAPAPSYPLWPVHGRANYGEAEQDAPSPAAYASRAVTGVAAGFTALKFDLDVPNPHRTDPASGTISAAELEYMESLVAAVRSEVGSEIDIAFDCHWRYNPADAARLAQALEPYRLMWLEDPIPPDNPLEMAKVCRASTTPIGTGENVYLRHGFRPLLENDGVDVVAPDIQKVGGLAEAKRVADMADVYGVALAPHCIASPLGTVAAAHVAACCPNVIALEWHGMDVPYWDDVIVGDGPLIRDGQLRVPEAPGLGVDLDEEVAAAHAKPGEPFFGS